MSKAPLPSSHRGKPTEFGPVIGERIRARRRELGWSQQKVADLFGVGREVISRYETGQVEVNAGDLPHLARILSVPIMYLYGLVLPSGEQVPALGGKSASDYVAEGTVDVNNPLAGTGGFMKAVAEVVHVPWRVMAPDEEELLAYYRSLSKKLKTVLVSMARVLYQACVVDEGEGGQGAPP